MNKYRRNFNFDGFIFFTIEYARKKFNSENLYVTLKLNTLFEQQQGLVYIWISELDSFQFVVYIL